ncbi:class II fructose-bisphosphate aldolase, partial [Borreliella garinii]
GNVKLTPKVLKDGQDYVILKTGLNVAKPVSYVFHGGSGSTIDEINEALSYGVVKMNIDTDTQWAAWEGVLNYYKKNESRLQGQLGD